MIRLDLKECSNGIDAVEYTRVFATCEGDCLKVRFVAADATPHPKYTGYNQPLYEGDVVEIFLTLGRRDRYLELEVNQNGAVFAGIVENPHNDRSFTIEMLPEFGGTVEVSTLDRVWMTDISLPIEWLSSLGFNKDEAYVNFCREDFDDDGKMSIYAAYPTYSQSFHDTHAFEKWEIIETEEAQ